MISRVMRAICRVIAICAVIGGTLTLSSIALCILDACGWHPPHQLGFITMNWNGLTAPVGTPLAYRFAAALLEAVSDLFAIWVFAALYGLMRIYDRGDIFSSRALGLVTMIGYGLLGHALALLICHPLANMVLTLPQARGTLSMGFGTDDFVRLFQAAVVFVIARVMSEARRLADENARFV